MIYLHRYQESIPDYRTYPYFEIDFRNNQGLTVSHNLTNTNNLEKYKKYVERAKTVIANVKESGVEELIDSTFGLNNIYFLDSQIPDIVRLSKIDKFKGHFILRLSDYEPINLDLIQLTECHKFWIDATMVKNIEYFIKDFETFCIINELNDIEIILTAPDVFGYKNRINNICFLKYLNLSTNLNISIITKNPLDFI